MPLHSSEEMARHWPSAHWKPHAPVALELTATLVVLATLDDALDVACEALVEACVEPAVELEAPPLPPSLKSASACAQPNAKQEIAASAVSEPAILPGRREPEERRRGEEE